MENSSINSVLSPVITMVCTILSVDFRQIPGKVPPIHSALGNIDLYFIQEGLVMNSDAKISRRFVTVKDILEANPFLTHGWLREQLFFRDRNGLAACVVQLGRKLLIDIDAFEQWLLRRQVKR